MNFLNSSLDIPHIHRQLKAETRVLIQNVFSPQVAETLHRSVRDQSDWEHVYLVDANEPPRQEKLASIRAMSPDDRQSINRLIVEQARLGYQFSYNRYSILEAVLNRFDPNNFMHTFLHYLNSEEFIRFARAITGDEQIMKCDAQSCWYGPGQFLKLHQDNNPPEEDRRYAFVVGLTKRWHSDWGGLLQFVDSGQVTRTITPAFNVLTIFQVPQDHQVSYVAPFATEPRLTVTGWMRAR